MGVLAGLAAGAAIAAIAGCYSPSLRDCTVSCGSASDCASGQVCGSDGMCAAPAMAGRCAMLVDAGGAPPHGDAGPPRDAGADAPPDAAGTIRLTVQVTGHGSVVVAGVGTCSSMDPQKGNCAYDVTIGVALTAQAMPIDPGDVFSMWTSMTCAGQGARCVFTPVAATTVTARFVRSGMHGAL